MPHIIVGTSTRRPSFQDSLSSTVSGLNHLLHDPYLIFKFKSFTESYAVTYQKQEQHIETRIVDGVTMYQLCEPVALAIWSGARDLRAYILESANNFRLEDALTRPMPHFIPLHALQSLVIADPVIAHTPFLYDSNPLLEPQTTMKEIWIRVNLVQLVLLITLQWLTKALRQCIDEKLQAAWFWGARFGMPNVEFYQRMGVEEAEGLLTESKVATFGHYPVFDNDQLILHPTQSRMARVFSAGTMVKYEGGRLPLPDLENEEENDGSMLADLQLDG